MSLQSKFFVYFLAIALTPILIVGAYSFFETQNKLTSATTEHLSSIANLQKERVNDALEQYLKEIELVNVQTEGITSPERLTGIINNITTEVRTIGSISIADTNGTIISSTYPEHVGNPISLYWRGKDHPFPVVGYHIHEVFKDALNMLHIRIHGPRIINGKVIGFLEIEERIDVLIAITEDYTGLGKAGEVVLAEKNQAGDALFLTPLRFDASAAFTRVISSDETDNPMTQALQGEEKVFTDMSTKDYRGTPVFAVTRFIPATGWGLVAKIDRDEALSPASAFRNTFLLIVLFTLFIIVALSLFVSNTLASPLIRLTLRAKALATLDFSATTTTTTTDRKDELGMLSHAFNTMVVKLKESYATLEQKVKARTIALAEAQEIGKIGSWEWNIVSNVVTWSDELFRIFGLNKQTVTLTFESYIQFIYPDDQKLARNVVGESLKTHNPFEFDHRVKLSDGTIRWIRGKGKIILDDSNRPISMVGTAQDITKEKEIDRAKNEFVSLASHQLRTPLTDVSWHTEMILKGDLGEVIPGQKKYLEEIYQGNKRMIELVNTLLDVSRLELGTFKVTPSPTDVIALAESVLAEQKQKIEKKKLIIVEKLSKDVPTFSTDPKLLRMVFQNLLANSVEYTPEGGKIEFSISLDKERENIEIKVSDTGYGIQKNQQDKIFTKFFRADNIREKDTDGTGLGLYIVKSIVENSGGKIWFESPYFVETSKGKEEIQGTTFHVTLPLDELKKSA